MISDHKVLITGGAGFIGSHIAERLVNNNTVIIFDSMKRSCLEFTDFKTHPNLTIVEGDIRDYKHLTEVMKGVDICVHAAAIAGIYSVGVNPSETFDVNMIGSINCFKAAHENRVKRFLDFSTSEVYGPLVFDCKERKC